MNQTWQRVFGSGIGAIFGTFVALQLNVSWIGLIGCMLLGALVALIAPEPITMWREFRAACSRSTLNSAWPMISPTLKKLGVGLTIMLSALIPFCFSQYATLIWLSDRSWGEPVGDLLSVELAMMIILWLTVTGGCGTRLLWADLMYIHTAKGHPIHLPLLRSAIQKAHLVVKPVIIWYEQYPSWQDEHQASGSVADDLHGFAPTCLVVAMAGLLANLLVALHTVIVVLYFLTWLVALTWTILLLFLDFFIAIGTTNRLARMTGGALGTMIGWSVSGSGFESTVVLLFAGIGGIIVGGLLYRWHHFRLQRHGHAWLAWHYVEPAMK